ncbi:hypothetical protein KDW38_26185, partial [Burkholderia multivorans]|uniref:hypothetical protein n=1 Tax=Burkholderia multivorans TaxID=87883 RepID=UPI001B9A28A8
KTFSRQTLTALSSLCFTKSDAGLTQQAPQTALPARTTRIRNASRKSVSRDTYFVMIATSQRL